MGTRTALLLAGALLTSVVAVPGSAVAAAPARLIVRPAQGHLGDPIFVSGGGFVPGRQVTVFLRCGARSGVPVVTTRANRQGRFVGVRLELRGAGPARRCSFSGASRAAVSIRTRSVPYTLVPAGRPLARCSVRMCLQVQAFLVRLKNGARGNVVITGWPGAVADVTIARTPTGARYRALRLNWRGVGSVSAPVAPGLLKGLKARVFVRARLGRIAGAKVVPFHVMFGNR